MFRIVSTTSPPLPHMPKLEVFIIHTELIKVHKSALIERGFMRNLNIIICKDAITSFKHYVLLYIQWRDVVEWEGVDEGSLGPLGSGGLGGILEKMLRIYAK